MQREVAALLLVAGLTGLASSVAHAHVDDCNSMVRQAPEGPFGVSLQFIKRCPTLFLQTK